MNNDEKKQLVEKIKLLVIQYGATFTAPEGLYNGRLLYQAIEQLAAIEPTTELKGELVMVDIDPAKNSDMTAYFCGYDDEGLAIYRGVSL